MDLDRNIKNAFQVVRKTYENLYKLMGYLDGESINKNYKKCIDRFLRYSSDSDYNGWLYNNFIKIYQSIDDPELDSQWNDGPIYCLEFSFKGYPKMIVSKFDFDIKDWGPGIVTNTVKYFSNPVNLELKNEFKHEDLEGFIGYKKSLPLDGISKAYWGLNYAIFREFDLTEINVDNASMLVFDEFDKMKDMI